MNIRTITEADYDNWLMLRCALWPDDDIDNHRVELELVLGDKHRRTALLCVDEQDAAIGFAEVSLRPRVDGCATSPVGFLDALFVKPDARRTGVARALVEAAQAWASSRGCGEFASEVSFGNDDGQAAHTAFGFLELERVVRYRMALPEPAAPRHEPPVDTSVSVSDPERAPGVVPQVSRDSGDASWVVVHVTVAVLALVFIWFTDISSPDVMRGAVYPALAFLCLLYVGIVLAVGRYRSRTNESDRGDDLFR